MTADGALLKLRNQDYHSTIGFAAYSKGLSVDETLTLYSKSFLRWVGYLDLYAGRKRKLLANFEAHGLDLANSLGA